MIADHYRDRFLVPITPTWPPTHIPTFPTPAFIPPTRAEFDALKREVENMKALLARAKKYDEDNNEPDCETEDKMKFLRQVAKSVGIDLDDVIGKPSA